MIRSTLNADGGHKLAQPGIMTRKHLYTHYELGEQFEMSPNPTAKAAPP